MEAIKWIKKTASSAFANLRTYISDTLIPITNEFETNGRADAVIKTSDTTIVRYISDTDIVLNLIASKDMLNCEQGVSYRKGKSRHSLNALSSTQRNLYDIRKMKNLNCRRTLRHTFKRRNPMRNTRSRNTNTQQYHPWITRRQKRQQQQPQALRRRWSNVKYRENFQMILRERKEEDKLVKISEKYVFRLDKDMNSTGYPSDRVNRRSYTLGRRFSAGDSSPLRSFY